MDNFGQSSIAIPKCYVFGQSEETGVPGENQIMAEHANSNQKSNPYYTYV